MSTHTAIAAPPQRRRTDGAPARPNIWMRTEKVVHGCVAEGAIIPRDAPLLPLFIPPEHLEEWRALRGATAAVRVSVAQNLRDFTLREARFVAFADYSPAPDTPAIRRMLATGHKRWEHVRDHVAWVRELRGE
jgi:hypothetical protein